LAERLGADLFGDPSLRLHGVAGLAEAGPGDLTVLTDPARLGQAQACGAGAFLVKRRVEELDAPQLVCGDTGRALGQLLDIFHPPAEHSLPGVDPRAAVDPSAEVDPEASVGPFAYVGARAVVGAASRVEPFSYIGPGARVGRQCRVGPGATLLDGCFLADEVVLGPGAVVGHWGFGYWRDSDGWHRIRGQGAVSVGEGAEIGANACVDQGTLGNTLVGPGVKLDNLVQVGHNCRIEDRALLCAQVGLAGSVTLEEDTVLAGQVGVADHLRVGQGARVGAQSGIARDVPRGVDVSGYPALEHRAWLRNSAVFGKLADLARQVRRLGRQVAQLKQGISRQETRPTTEENTKETTDAEHR